MSEKKELISVIIPVYNGERFLRKCLESVQNQTYNELEIIVVNDGSTDNTIRILEDISREDKRVKIINYEIRKGVSEARNTALDSFNGEYVVFVDCDDFVSNDYIETMYKEIDKYDVVCSGYNEIEKGIVCLTTFLRQPSSNGLLSPTLVIMLSKKSDAESLQSSK